MKLNSNYFLFTVWIACSVPVFSQTTSDNQSQSGSSQEYQGPSILSRDKSLIGERGGKLLDFRLYGSITGVYDSGLTPVSVNSSGNLVPVGSNFGTEIGYGVLGSRTWRRDSLSLEYRGSYRHYQNNSYFDGTDQFLNLRYSRTLTRHFTLDLKETGGMTSLGNGGFSYLPLSNLDTFVPTNELFDNTTYYSQSRVGLIWQKSARLSFSVDGEGFLIRRRSGALAGLNGYSAHIDGSYRITRRQTVSVDYNFTHFDYQKLFGNADIQTLSLGYSVGVGKRWETSVSLGGSVMNVTGLQTVQVDPAIVAIIGQATITQTFNRTISVPYAGLNIVRRFPRSSLGLTASTGVSPGNGVYLTSRQTTAGAQYSYVGVRRWTLGANGAFSELSTLGQSLGKYQGYQGGLGATYKITGAVHAEFRYDYRHYTTQNSIFQKDSHRVSIGLAFSPGEKPLPIW